MASEKAVCPKCKEDVFLYAQDREAEMRFGPHPVDDAKPLCVMSQRRVSEGSGEQVDHPSHYGGADNAYEAIKVIEAWGLGFCLGNTVKYIARAGKKGDRLEDLRKARWYLEREIKKMEES